MKIRVLVADDHPLIRAGIIAILAEMPDIEVVAEASSGNEAIRKLATHTVDILVLDLAMSSGSGFDVLGQLSLWDRRPRVLVLSAHPEDQLAVQVLRSGASGYLAKEAAPDLLVAAIRRIHSGRKYVTEGVAEQLVEAVEVGYQRAPHESLSPRELQVFMMLARGRKVSEIAKDLAISPSTAHTFRRRIMEKLGLLRDVELARYALQHKLVD